MKENVLNLAVLYRGKFLPGEVLECAREFHTVIE